MNEPEIRARVRRAVRTLFVRDVALLERDAAERAIAARLAVHLASVFRDHHVDVEYNRHGLDPKEVRLPPSCRGGGKRLIVPDIVVHHRGHDGDNLLVVELKKRSNHESRVCDRAKIVAMKRELGYQCGVLIVLPAGGEAKGGKADEEWL